MGFIGTNLLL